MKPMTKTVTIASGATDSEAIRVDNYVVAGLLMPAAFTGTAITFLASDKKDGTFRAVYDSDGVQVSAAVAISQAVGLSSGEADAMAPWAYIKLVSNAAEAADREIGVALK